MKKLYILILTFLLYPIYLFSTVNDSASQSSIHHIGHLNENNPDDKKYIKIHHAEPLYIDLIRDLGAYKGEKEWNVGLGWIDHKDYEKMEALVEYEFAPVDRLGLEIEIPVSIYFDAEKNETTPKSKINSLKLAAQYTFLVVEKINTSMAIGYIHEFKLTEFKNYGKENFFTGNIYNPFVVIANNWGKNFHTLIYAGPEILHQFEDKSFKTNWMINTNFHYMLPNSGNFVGIELNKEIYKNNFDITLRPQMRLTLNNNLKLGLVGGVTINNPEQRLSVFSRLIYEPDGKRKRKN